MKKLTKKQMAILTKRDSMEPEKLEWKGVEILVDREMDFASYLYSVSTLAKLTSGDLHTSHFYPSLDIIADSFIVENFTNISTPDTIQDTFKLIIDMRKDGVMDRIYEIVDYPKKDKLMKDLYSHLNYEEQISIRRRSNGLIELIDLLIF